MHSSRHAIAHCTLSLRQVRDKSAFFGKDGLLNSVPKVKGVLLQSTTYTPK